MKKIYIPIITLFSFCTNISAQNMAVQNKFVSNTPKTNVETSAQSKSRSELKGDKHAFGYSYSKAINSYSNTKELTIEGQRKLANSYTQTNQNLKAEEVYSKMINAPYGISSEDYFNYAMVLKTNAKYTEANYWLNKFAEIKPNDLRAKDFIANKTNLTELLKDKNNYKITHLDANTNAQDFGTCFYKNKIVFSSTRSSGKMINRKYNANGKPFLDLYVADIDSNQITKPKRFDKLFNHNMHDGPTSFNREGTFMAFTQNNYDLKGKDKVVKLQIFFSTNTNGKWSKPIPFALNNKDYSVGQPCLTSDGNTMYFSSDMPGGYGGIDIYKVTKNEKGEWSNAENMGDKINTEGDELFPFYKSGEDNEMFFFSSNGHYGIGGLDIFVCEISKSKLGKIHNVGFPLNSADDDFAVIINDKTNKGYFSSNRAGGSGDDDIYTVELLNNLNIGKRIKGIAKDQLGNPIAKTFITLLDEKNNVMDTLTTGFDAAYVFLVEADKIIKLTGKKENYDDGFVIASSFTKEAIIQADVILLTKEQILAEKIAKADDLGKALELKPIYFDLDKFNIRTDAALELDKIAKTMNNYPEMIVNLRSYTDCRESKEYNQKLSDKRAKASVDYIKKKITKPSRISGKGYGKSKMVNECECDGEVVSDCPEIKHQMNRRTEFIIVKK